MIDGKDKDEEQHMARWRVVLITGTLVSAIALALLMIYWLVRPYNGFEVYGPATPISARSVASGDVVAWKREKVCRGPYEVTSERWAERMIDARVVSRLELPDIQTPASMSPEYTCVTPFVSALVLPVYVPAGTYRIQTVSRYQPNPIRTVEVVSYSPVSVVSGVQIPVMDGRDESRTPSM